MSNPMSAQDQRNEMQQQSQGQTGYGSGSDDIVKPGQTGNNENGASQGQHAAEDMNDVGTVQADVSGDAAGATTGQNYQQEQEQPGYGSTGQSGMGSAQDGSDTGLGSSAMGGQQSGGMSNDADSRSAIGGMGGQQSNSDPMMDDDEAMIDDDADGAGASSAGGGM